MRHTPDEKPSLLERLGHQGKWLLAIKDLGTILSLPPLQRNPIFGQLREIYDGKYDADFGTGVEVKWAGKLGVLTGATPAIDRQYKWNVELGERFVQFRPPSPHPGNVALKAALVADRDEEMKTRIAAAYGEAFKKATRCLESSAGTDDHIPPEAILIGSVLAQLVAVGRTPVFRENDVTYEVSESEGPGRLTKIFQQLLGGALMCHSGDLEAATRLVVRVAMDSIPGKRGKILLELARHPYGVTAGSVSAVLRCDDNTARRVLEDLVELRLAASARPGKTIVYRASTDLLDYAARVYLDEYEPEVAIRKLFDLPINIISEEVERGSNGG